MSPMSLQPSFQLICFIWAESVLPGPLAQRYDTSRCLRLWQSSCMSHCAPPLLRPCALLHRFSAAPIDLSWLSFTSLMRLFFEFSSPGDMIISSLFTWLEFSENSFQCFVFNIPVFKSAPVLGIFSLLWQNHSEYWREGGKIYWGLEFRSLTLGPNTICLL